MNIPQLTFTRFVAAFSVVILHFGLLSPGIGNTSLLSLFSKADAAVSYFFALSGFILVVSSARNGLPSGIAFGNFLKKRFARIFPVYLFAILVYFALEFHFDPNGSLRGQFQPYLYAVTLLQAWHYGLVMDVNFPAWSLSVEAFFYVVFPLLFSLLKGKSRFSLIVIALGSWGLLNAAFVWMYHADLPLNFIKFFPLFHLGTFVAGVCMGIWFVRYHARINGLVLQILWTITLLCSAVLIYAMVSEMFWWKYRHNGLLTPYYLLVIVTLASTKGRISSFLSGKPLVFLGEISYSVYLLQFPVMLCCRKYIAFFQGKEDGAIFWWYALLLIALSAGTYVFIEKPAKKIVLRWFKVP